MMPAPAANNKSVPLFELLLCPYFPPSKKVVSFAFTRQTKRERVNSKHTAITYHVLRITSLFFISPVIAFDA